MLTAKQAIHHIEHTLAGRPEIDPIDIVNGGGKLLYQMREWNFRMRGPQTLDFVANQSYIVLPVNFGTLKHVQFTDRRAQRVHRVTPSELQEMRLDFPGVSQNADYWVSISFDTPTATSNIGPRLELYPEPDAALADAFTVLYATRWVDAEDDDTLLQGVPELAENLYIRVVRQLARSYEDEDTESYTDLLGSLRMSEEYRGAVKDDVSVHGSYGVLNNGIGFRDRRRLNSFWDRPVNAPS